MGDETPIHDSEGKFVGRLIEVVRLGVVVSTMLYLLLGSPQLLPSPTAAWTVIAVTGVYAALVMRRVRWERRGAREATLVSSVDAVLATAILYTTGASASPAIAILFLVVVAASIRIPIRRALMLTAVVAATVLAMGLLADSVGSPSERLVFSLWWSLYLLFAGVLTSGLSFLGERQHHAAIAARVETLAERNVAEQERDLRERLLASYQAQRDTLRIILHDFRTPVQSLRALARSLARDDNQLSFEARGATVELLVSHTEHLGDMLGGLTDVARSEAALTGSPRRRAVELGGFLLAAADAGGLRPPRLRLQVDPEDAEVILDVASVRRVIINLADNTVRHAGAGPVDIVASVYDGTLSVNIRDKGPGLGSTQLEQVTDKYIAFGDSLESDGLGLWIVQQIVRALGGSLQIQDRREGGLEIRVNIPV